MVVFDSESSSCKIYEIKHSVDAVPEQCTHLLDVQKCEATLHRFGAINGKYVIYRGESKMIEMIHYWNVEEYHNQLV